LTVRADPEGAELKAAEKFVSFEGKEVLEIGCGEGRFTAKYADKARSVVAVDADEDSIQLAQASSTPAHLRSRVRFLAGDAENLELASQAFDVVIFSWSLCCLAKPLKALREAHRALRPRGAVVNLMPDAVPTFETATIQELGGKGAIYEGSLGGFRALVAAVREGLFAPFEEERVTFRTYFDSAEDFVGWLPSKLGPFNREEFAAMAPAALEAIKDYASTYLTRDGGGLLVKDALIVSAATKQGGGGARGGVVV
jgi:SAM-dependent methyltransferase